MNTRARVTVARTADRLAPRLWLAFGVLALGAGIAALRPALSAGGTLRRSRSPRPISSPRSSDPSRCIPTTSSRLFFRRRRIRCKSFKRLGFWRIEKPIRACRPIADWDDSIVALLNYPEVVKLLNDDLDWTYDLGTAVLNQRADVLNAIQIVPRPSVCGRQPAQRRAADRCARGRSDRDQARGPAGHLRAVLRAGARRRLSDRAGLSLLSVPLPRLLLPVSRALRVRHGLSGACSSWFSIGWHSHHVHVYDPYYHNHPYYGWSYYDPFYVHNVYVNVNVNNHDYVWQPHYRYGGRPVVRGYEGRVYTANTPRVARHAPAAAWRAARIAAAASRARAQPRQRRSRGSARNRAVASLDDRNRGIDDAARDGDARRRSRHSAPRAPQQPQRRQQAARASRSERDSARIAAAAVCRRRSSVSRAPSWRTSLAAPRRRARRRRRRECRENRHAASKRGRSPPRAAAPRRREPSGGGMSQAMRGGDGGNGGGSYRRRSYRGGGERRRRVERRWPRPAAARRRRPLGCALEADAELAR